MAEQVMQAKPGEVNIDELCQLAHTGDIKSIKELLAKHENLASKADKSGRTLIHWASAGGHTDIVKMLVYNYNIDPDIRDEVSWTPLLIASSAGRDDIVRYLLDVGAQVNAVNSTGQCALHYAASKDRQQITQMLLEKGADTNIADQMGCTPLHRAASKGHTSITKLLLTSGAHPNICDAEGNSPLHMACEEDRESDVRLLVSSGADVAILNKEEKTAFMLASRSLQQRLSNMADINTRTS